jgi:3-methyl-2-oxobutanoate hydroxymethyltransferase
MIYHCRAVVNGCKRALIVGDLPFGSYEISPPQAMSSAYRLVKEGSVDAVKLEGGRKMAETVHRIVEGGIAVMGHIGLTPASVSAIGGFRSFGRNSKEAIEIFQGALALEEAGAFAVVLECIPHLVAKHITECLSIPTIGIGAGKYTSGQVLVYHDMIGMLQHPHHAKVTPKFCKKYAQVGEAIQEALENYRDEVMQGKFPNETYSPYHISEEEYEKFVQEMQKLRPPVSSSATIPDNLHENVQLYGDTK